MFVLANFFYAIALVLKIFIVFEIFCIVVSAILSWLPFYGPLYHFCNTFAELVNRPLRRFIPPIGMFDITPMVSILLLVFLDAFLVRTLFDLAVRLR